MDSSNKITAHRTVRGRGGELAIIYETRSKVMMRVAWEREIDLQRFHRGILLYWAGITEPKNQIHPNVRNMGKAAANGSRAAWRRNASARKDMIFFPMTNSKRFFPTKKATRGRRLIQSSDSLWRLGKIHARDYMRDQSYILRFLDEPVPLKIDLLDARYTSDLDGQIGSWCLQTHEYTTVQQAVERNVDTLRAMHDVNTSYDALYDATSPCPPTALPASYC